VTPCWAFNKQGQRCQGHSDGTVDHSFTVTWGDDDCWTPGQAPQGLGAPEAWAQVINGTPLEPAVAPEPLEPLPAPGNCFTCGHPPHDDDACTGMLGKAACDCSSYVP